MLITQTITQDFTLLFQTIAVESPAAMSYITDIWKIVKATIQKLNKLVLVTGHNGLTQLQECVIIILVMHG